MSDPTAPTLVGYFTIDELEVNTYPRMSVYDDGVMAVSMQDAGFVLYDVSEPLAPTRLSDGALRFGASPAAAAVRERTPYLLGVLDAKRVGAADRWVLLVSDDGVGAELRVVDYHHGRGGPSPDLEPGPEPEPPGEE